MAVIPDRELDRAAAVCLTVFLASEDADLRASAGEFLVNVGRLPEPVEPSEDALPLDE